MNLCIRLFKNSVEVPGTEMEEISRACSESNTYAAVGINERTRGTMGTMYNTQLFFGPDSTLLHKHKKFVPTVAERLVHPRSTTGLASAIKTEFDSVGALICADNMNPDRYILLA